MVGFVIHNAVASVYLFQKDHLHQLMRKSHSGKAELIICTFQNTLINKRMYQQAQKKEENYEHRKI